MALTFETIAETLTLTDDWEGRYAALIDFGKSLPPLAEAWRTDAHLVPGCTSRVWMQHSWADNGALNLALDSDAHIVKGLLAVLWALYHGQTAPHILDINTTEVFARLGLDGHISPNRRSGFFAVSERIKALAQAR